MRRRVFSPYVVVGGPPRPSREPVGIVVEGETTPWSWARLPEPGTQRLDSGIRWGNGQYMRYARYDPRSPNIAVAYRAWLTSERRPEPKR